MWAALNNLLHQILVSLNTPFKTSEEYNFNLVFKEKGNVRNNKHNQSSITCV